MRLRYGCWICSLVIAWAVAANAQDRAVEPLLMLEAGGPTSFVTSLAFSPDGLILYASGWDKVVRVWTWNEDNKEFVPRPDVAYRIPIGPGLNGAINAIAVSPDGDWLAVGGMSTFRGVAGFREGGGIFKTAGGMTDEMWRDMGTIFVFHTKTRQFFRLPGHLGPVLSLVFAPGEKHAPVLVSASEERGVIKDNQIETVKTVRVWDLQKKQQLSSMKVPDNPASRDCGLAVSRKGESLQVAMAWGDGRIRVWLIDQRTGGVIKQGDDKRSNVAIAHDAARDWFITGSHDGPRGRFGYLSIWDIRDGQLRKNAAQGFSIPSDAKSHYVPNALTLFSSDANGASDFVAVASMARDLSNMAAEKVQVQIVSLEAKGFGEERFRFDLWKSPEPARAPAIAASTNGSHLAIAGNANHEIWVYSVADLLKKNARKQVLASVGTNHGFVSFAESGELTGLLISAKPKQAMGSATSPPQDPGNRILEFKTGKLIPFDAETWKAVWPDSADWKVAIHLNAGVQTISLRRGEKLASNITLPIRELVTDSAVLPGGILQGAPALLAVASHDLGQPRLRLYNAENGEWLRQYSGHSERIHSVAFSKDGRFLATTAEDQTVCLWGLSDLNEVLGQRGALRGITLDRRPAVDGVETFVTEVEDDSPATGKLNVGDVLRGVVFDGKLEKWNSSREGYESFWNSEPGDTIKLRRERGGRSTDLDVPISQGTDERKPLLSLFVTNANTLEKQPQWIGWSPFGPFQSSNRDVEKYVGWHFNPVNERDPVAFVDVKQHRDKFYQGDLLWKTIRGEDLERGGKEAKLELWIRDLDVQAQETGDCPTLRRKDHDLVVELDGIDTNEIKSIKILHDDKELANVLEDEEQDRRWKVSLAKTDWKPNSSHILRAVVIPRNSAIEPISKELSVRFEPIVIPDETDPKPPLSAPEFIIKHANPDTVVISGDGPANYPVSVELPNPRDLEQYDLFVTVDENQERKAILVEDSVIESFDVSLGIGRHQLRIALEDKKTKWSVSKLLEVDVVNPPRIDSLIDVREKGDDAHIAKLEATIVSPTIRPLTKAEWRIGESPPTRLFRYTFKEDRQVNDPPLTFWKVRFDVPLQPGGNDIRLEAWHESAKSVEAGKAALAGPGIKGLPAPELEFLDLPDTTAVGSQTVKYRVRSAGEIKQVTLQQGESTLVSINNPDAKKNFRGEFEFEGEYQVDLLLGVNRLRLRAASAGEPGLADHLISYIAPPVRIVIDKITLLDDPNTVYKPALQSDNSMRFQDIAQGQAQVHGRVIWSKSDERQHRRSQQLKTWVNGFQQQRTTLNEPRPQSPDQRGFVANVVLNRTQGNVVEVALPGLEEDVTGRVALTVDCLKPIIGQRLHLVIVGVGVPPSHEEDLKVRAHASVGIAADANGKLHAPAFDEVVDDYAPIAFYVTPQRLKNRFKSIATKIRQPANEINVLSDVVMIYYEGGEMINAADQFYLKTDVDYTKVLGECAIGSDEILDIFGNTPGAHVFLMDVEAQAEATATVADWKEESRAGVLCYVTRRPRAELRLNTDLRDAVTKHAELGKVGEELQTLADTQPSREPKLTFERLIPAALQHLIIGKTARKN